MREIEFRGINNETGKFVYGWYTKMQEGARIFDAIISIVDGEFTRFYIHDAKTIGQFTGLCDKNGVKIFCGDILDEDGSLFIVVWDNEWAKFKLQYASPKSIQYPEWNRGKKMIIVGNIHQHPHLLEQKK